MNALATSVCTHQFLTGLGEKQVPLQCGFLLAEYVDEIAVSNRLSQTENGSLVEAPLYIYIYIYMHVCPLDKTCQP